MANQTTRVGVSPPLEGVDLERALGMAASLDHALEEAHCAWLGANLHQTTGPSKILGGLGLFIGAAVRQVIGGLALPPAAAAATRERWLARLRADLAQEG